MDPPGTTTRDTMLAVLHRELKRRKVQFHVSPADSRITIEKNVVPNIVYRIRICITDAAIYCDAAIVHETEWRNYRVGGTTTDEAGSCRLALNHPESIQQLKAILRQWWRTAYIGREYSALIRKAAAP